MSIDDAQRIRDLIQVKFNQGKESNITQNDIDGITFIFSDDNSKPGIPTITSDILNKLSPQTITEIRVIQSLD